MKKLLSICLVCALVLGLAVLPAGAYDEPLSFKDGKFTVLQITDTQDDQYPAYNMINLIKLSVEKLKPDLVILTGDVVEDSRVGDVLVDDESGREGVKVENSDGSLNYEATLANVKAACAAIFGIFEDAKIPFAVTQGNNDYSSGITNEDWLAIYSQYEYCLVTDESGDADGKIDFNLEVLGSDGSTAFNFYLCDNGRGTSDAQIDWYKSTSNALKEKNGGEAVPSMVFEHAPVGETGYVSGGSGSDSAQFAAWKEQGDVLGAYFGHMHYEGFTGTYDGIELGLTYGAEFAKSGPYGARVITLYEDNIENYSNDLYIYCGDVKLGTAKLVKQGGILSFFMLFLAKLIAFFENIF